MVDATWGSSRDCQGDRGIMYEHSSTSCAARTLINQRIKMCSGSVDNSIFLFEEGTTFGGGQRSEESQGACHVFLNAEVLVLGEAKCPSGHDSTEEGIRTQS